MRRLWIDVWSLVAALALAAALLLRWQRGEVAMVPGAAARAIRLLALLIVFAQGCADKLRRKDEPAGQGAVPGVGAGQGEGQVDADGAGEGAGEPDVEDVDTDMPGEQGAKRPGDADMAQWTGIYGDFPLHDSAGLTRCIRLLSDQGFRASGYKQLTRRLATVAEGTGAGDPVWGELRGLVDALPVFGGEAAAMEAFMVRWRAHLEAREQGRPDTIDELQALLLAAEALPLFDAWLAAYVWRRAGRLPASAQARAELLGRIERHLRVRYAIVRAQLEAGPVEFTAWRSKAAPPKGWQGDVVIPPGLLAAARTAYATVDVGTWEAAGTLELTVRSAGVTLVRRGQARPLKVGQHVTLRRLDLLQASRPAALRHDELGDMFLSAGESATAWDVGERLGSEAKARVKERVAAAQAGDAAALRGLEAILPAAHGEIRAAVAARPDAPGSAGLRMLLALFEE